MAMSAPQGGKSRNDYNVIAFPPLGAVGCSQQNGATLSSDPHSLLQWQYHVEERLREQSTWLEGFGDLSIEARLSQLESDSRELRKEYQRLAEIQAKVLKETFAMTNVDAREISSRQPKETSLVSELEDTIKTSRQVSPESAASSVSEGTKKSKLLSQKSFEYHQNAVTELRTKRKGWSDKLRTGLTSHHKTEEPGHQHEVKEMVHSVGIALETHIEKWWKHIELHDSAYDNVAEQLDEIKKAVQEQGVEVNEIITSKKREHSKEEDIYHLQSTTWDSAVFFFAPLVSTTASVAVVFIFFVATLVQVVIALLVMQAYVIDGDEPITEERVHEAYLWRLKDGHSFLAGGSGRMVEQVCAGDKSLSVAGNQVRMLDDIRTYTAGYLQHDDLAIGQLLLMIVLTVWIMTVLRDLVETWDFLGALWKRPLSKETRIVHSDHNHTYSIKSMTIHRLVFVFATSAPRIFIDICMMLGGCYWLLEALTFEDLIGNSVALTFIFEMDGLFFRLLAPHEIRKMTRAMEPLVLPGDRYKFRGATVHGKLVLTILPLLGVVSFFYVACSVPLLSRMKDIEEMMCGGNLTSDVYLGR